MKAGQLAEDCEVNKGRRTGGGVGTFQVWRTWSLERGKVMLCKKGVRTSSKMGSRVGLLAC